MSSIEEISIVPTVENENSSKPNVKLQEDSSKLGCLPNFRQLFPNLKMPRSATERNLRESLINNKTTTETLQTVINRRDELQKDLNNSQAESHRREIEVINITTERDKFAYQYTTLKTEYENVIKENGKLRDLLRKNNVAIILEESTPRFREVSVEVVSLYQNTNPEVHSEPSVGVEIPESSSISVQTVVPVEAVQKVVAGYTFATLPKTTRGTPIVLGGDPKGKNFLYTNGNSVIIRNIENPAISDVYTEHSAPVIVAKYSPSGFYIASADLHGKIRIWETVNKEHILKNEFQPIVGPIKDIAWSPDSQRMVVVGEGRERFGHVFMSDTGTSVGEISGQSKSINSCDFRPSRPFRIITGSEDNTIGIFEGPPFKFKMTKKEHTRFVQVVRYSPNGEKFASGGFEGKAYLYEANDSELIGEIGSPAHVGGVYGLAWSPDSKQLLTSSGDKTCRLWNAETREMISEFTMGTQIDDQQVSCLWQGPYIITVSLSGFITYLDVNNPGTPVRVVTGHNKPITVMCLDEDRGTIFTGSHDGWVTRWDAKTGVNQRISGTGHGNQINGMKVVRQTLFTCGIDDTVRVVDLSTNSYVSGNDLKLDSQPRGMDIHNNRIYVATVNEIMILEISGATIKKVVSLNVSYQPSSLAINTTSGDVAVGGYEDQKVHVYSVIGSTLTEKAALEHLGSVTDVSYSPDGNYLAASDGHRKVVLYSTTTYEPAHNKEWGFHSAKVNCVAWSPDSKLVASGSVDCTVIVWSVDQPSKHLTIKNAHPQNPINALAWLDNATVVSTGQDANTKIWEISGFPQ